MAAALLDPAAVLRAPPSVAPPPRAAMAMAVSSSSSLPGAFRVELATKFMGLKVGGRRSRAPVERKRRDSGGDRRGVVCEASETTVEVQDVTTDTWQRLVMECDMPVLVEFWAQWCGPCRTIHPVIGEIAKEYAGKLKCFKLNTDESPDVATTYKIRSIPTIMMFINGEQKETIIGAVPKATLTSSIDKFV